MVLLAATVTFWHRAAIAREALHRQLLNGATHHRTWRLHAAAPTATLLALEGFSMLHLRLGEAGQECLCNYAC